MKIKILFIISSFSKGGGAESLLTTIVNNLNPNKYEIGIVEIIHDNIKAEPINDNIKVYPYYVRADDPEYNSKMYYVYHEWDKVIEGYIPQDYDIYISFNYLKPTFLLPPGKKNVAWIHSDVYVLARTDKQEEYALQNTSFYKANRIVSISDITTQSLIELFPEHKDKLRVLYNGLDIQRVTQKSKETTKVELQHPAVLSIGRLEKRKNPLRLLNIFGELYKKDSRVHLYYLGYGELSEDVLRIAVERGLSDNVHLLGYYDNPFPIIAQCDVVCMFSDSEGFPMALLEGVALGKPFVSSIIGGARILANNQRCGRVITTDEEAALAIEDLLHMDMARVEEECQKSIKRFGLDNYIQQIEALFDEMLK